MNKDECSKNNNNKRSNNRKTTISITLHSSLIRISFRTICLMMDIMMMMLVQMNIFLALYPKIDNIRCIFIFMQTVPLHRIQNVIIYPIWMTSFIDVEGKTCNRKIDGNHIHLLHFFSFNDVNTVSLFYSFAKCFFFEYQKSSCWCCL